MQRRILALAALCGAALVPGLAISAENFPISYTTVGVEGSYVDSGNSRNKSAVDDNLNNYLEGGLNLTHQFTPNVSLFAQAAYAEPETRVNNIDIELWRFSLGGRIHPGKFRLAGWRPFGGAGYSNTNLDIDGGGSKNEDSLYLEGGLQRMMAPRFMFEAGVRARTELEDGYVDGQYFAGVHYLFNRKFPAAPRSDIAMAPAQEPVIAPPKDSDGDGVIDELDKCPNTPQGALVDADGCPKELTREIRETLYVEFELDKTEVREAFYPEIEKLAKVMKQYSTSTILLEGHTDSTGSASYNQRLSKSRADAVMKVLINEFGIVRDRITTSGMGESQPVASNNTPEGRAQNRRVEAIVSGEHTEIMKK
ncbi:OmpA family protein [Marinobacter sp.]|uniref:OmpA family protein n=1 Tax=Marinobacter sp. TaxID=50741 RepID=UPI0019FA8BF7|nr:OmpA family protein [Marinobacter sp.]MBE0487158.1 OmpA family protein [Marinobacter sp.]